MVHLNTLTLVLALAALLTVAACSGVSWETPQAYRTEQRERIADRYGTVHGGRGIVLFDTARRSETENGTGGALAVNTYLWRASLDTLDFLPLAQADSSGGVIISDWYSPPEAPNERFKLTVYIRDRALRADGVKVTVFRQVRSETGDWVDATVDPATATGIEDEILARARELRIASLGPAQ